MTTMAEFLLNNIPHHPKILRSSNCLNLRLPRHLQCKTCTTFLDDLAHNPNKKRRTSANKICKRPWQERNSASRMKVKMISYQGVQSFLSLKGIRHDTCDDDEASYTTGATGGTNGENHDDDHDDIVTAADGKDEPPSDIPKTSSSTIPATFILPATFTPTTATARATTSLDATSASTRSSASSDTSSQSSEPMTPASDDPNPTLEEEEGDATSASTRSSASSDTSSQSSRHQS
jgi:hypothetical protein